MSIFFNEDDKMHTEEEARLLKPSLFESPLTLNLSKCLLNLYHLPNGKGPKCRYGFYSRDGKKYLREIFLPLTPLEWCSLCMSNENGNFHDQDFSLSIAHDLLLKAFGSSGILIASDFYRLGSNLTDFLDIVVEDTTEYIEDPLNRVISLWKACIPYMDLERIRRPYTNPRTNPENVLDCITRVADLSLRLDTATMYSNQSKTDKDIIRWIFHGMMSPYIGGLVRHFENMLPEFFECWALLDSEDLPVETRLGPALFGTKKLAEEVLEYWEKYPVENGQKHRLAKVRCSIQHGIEIVSE